jgi:hypothetical protein
MNDPLGALDIGQSHLNKIKEIWFYIETPARMIDTKIRTVKNLNVGKNDDVIKKKCRQLAQKFKHEYGDNDVWVDIRYYDNDELIEKETIK